MTERSDKIRLLGGQFNMRLEVSALGLFCLWGIQGDMDALVQEDYINYRDNILLL